VCWQRSLALPTSRDAPRQARAFAVTALDELLGNHADITDDTALIVSELVANAVDADASSVMVSLDVHHSHVRVAVEDDGAGTPTLRNAAATDDHGRGLAIVAGLSEGWGVQPLQRGKQVWADVSVALPFSTADFECSYPSTRR
jgi:anti-sigma regulatory factor (Ser/Thr protein kinase)